jgi:hypothetical protein
MSAIGTAWILHEDVKVPKVLLDVMCAMQGGMIKLEDIDHEAPRREFESMMGDITEPIYDRCWWRGEVCVGQDDVYDSLTTFYLVSLIL